MSPGQNGRHPGGLGSRLTSLLMVNQLDIMLIQRRQKQAAVINVAIRSDRSIRKKGNENLEEHQGLKEELKEQR